MAAPEFRRRGLLTHVGQYAYERYREGGVPFVLGLPNEQWGSRAAALGWQPLFPLQWLIRPLQPQQLIARRLGQPLAARWLAWLGWLAALPWRPATRRDPAVQCGPIQAAGPEIDGLWRENSAAPDFSVVRDSAWLRWRYLSPPASQYHVWLARRGDQVAGYLAYRLEERQGRRLAFIVELWCPADDRARRSLLHDVLAELAAAGVELVATLAVPGSEVHRFWRRAGFFFSWGAFTVQLVPLDPDLSFSELADPGRWAIFGGDFDVV
jgi:hypothetical protein